MTFQPYTRDDLIALWRTLFPPSFTVPIETEENGQGLDVYAQQAAQLARASEAIAVTTQAYYLRPHSTQVRPPAGGATRATGAVLIARAAPAIGPITLVAGTRVVVRERDSVGETIEGEQFQLTADVTIPAGSLGPISAAIEAVRPGYQGNVGDGRISGFALRGRATVDPATVEAGNVLRDNGLPDRFTGAMVGQYVRLVGGANGGTFPRLITGFAEGPTSTVVVDGPPLIFPDSCVVEVEEYEDVGLSVTQPVETSGGRHGWLDAIGRDRNVGRALNEGDESYRLRIGSLDDVVSPNAILRAAARVLTPLGILFRLVETRDTTPGGLRGFVWDFDPLDYGSIGDGAVLIDGGRQTRYFAILVGNGNAGEFGFPLDATTPGIFNAWDVGFLDGYPVDYMAAIAALWSAIERARMAGVAWDLIRDPAL